MGSECCEVVGVMESHGSDFTVAEGEICVLNLPTAQSITDRPTSDSTLYDVFKNMVQDAENLVVLLTFWKPEESEEIRAVALQFPILFRFKSRSANLCLEKYVPDKYPRCFKSVFNYLQIRSKLTVVNEYTLMNAMAELHGVTLATLWNKSEDDIRALQVPESRAFLQSNNRRDSESDEPFRILEEDFKEKLSQIEDEKVQIELPLLKRKSIMLGEMKYHEYGMKYHEFAKNILSTTISKHPEPDLSPQKIEEIVDQSKHLKIVLSKNSLDLVSKTKNTTRSRTSKNSPDLVSKTENSTTRSRTSKGQFKKGLRERSDLDLKIKEELTTLISVNPFVWKNTNEILRPPIFCTNRPLGERYNLLTKQYGSGTITNINYQNKTYKIEIDSRFVVWNCRREPKPKQLMEPYDKASLKKYLQNPDSSTPPSLRHNGAFLIPFFYGLFLSYVCRRPCCGKVWRSRSTRDLHERGKGDTDCHFSYAGVLDDWDKLEKKSSSAPMVENRHFPKFYDFETSFEKIIFNSDDDSDEAPRKIAKKKPINRS
ncbi:uncharacterized protein LOC135843779 [Planococcus citri]|uniref:uncharacterized protein LOC135843779 n=1 Tax=Planococcus citri TaxID=170843 RepID=UPI0031F8687F